jgi:hypothetical protein
MPITTANLSSLIQRRGDAELPANGHWALHQVSFVGVSNLHDRLQLPVSNGMLSIADPPHPSSLTIVAARDDRWIRLTASTLAIHPDGHGLSTWQLTGTLDDGTTAHDVDVTMSYHGVRRRSDHAWAWFTGRARKAATPPRLLRRRGELTVVLDLLFNAPVRGIRDVGHPAHQLRAADTRPEQSQPHDTGEAATSPGQPTPTPALKPAC